MSAFGKGEHGSILVLTSVVVMTSMMVTGYLIEHFWLAEAHQVERSLAQLQLHWARVGIADYLMSRSRQEASMPASDAEKSILLGNYAAELVDPGQTEVKFVYPEIGSDYTFGIKAQIVDVTDVADGLMRVDVGVFSVGNLEILRNLPAANVAWSQITLCMGPGTGCPSLAVGQSRMMRTNTD
ncbi:hypothetical protein SIID45300_03261 [Candidatus Magnetaquicoccaceae bacterium FCR-1]|uniref:Uncharacterized protein n=1 Tax=Candidatus Magnetaquiglobus chichijimensis TaxID=3141448 RepID=A0ABQ0CDD0_9PROT